MACGVWANKKVFTDDIETIEILLAHAIPEGIGNLVTPAAVLIAMFFADWKLALLSLVALPIGGWFVLRGWSTLADFVLVLCMSFSIGVPLIKAMSFGGKVPQLNYKIEELERLLDHPPLKSSDKSFEGENHDIRFESVHFSYQEDEVIHGIDLEIKAGQMVALVGESGSEFPWPGRY